RRRDSQHMQSPFLQLGVLHCRRSRSVCLPTLRPVMHQADRDGSQPAVCPVLFSKFCVAELRYLPAIASRSRCSPFTNCRLPFSTDVKKWSPSATFLRNSLSE